MQLTRQIGEHLVAAELGRRGYLATPFAGNVPMFDLLVADIRGFALPVQVKAIRGPTWQFRIDTFLDIEIVDDTQLVRGRVSLPNPDLLCVFVRLMGYGGDEFYIFRLKSLQDHFAKHYRGGKRPRNPQSLHCAVGPDALVPFRDNWTLIDESFQLMVNEIEQPVAALTALPTDEQGRIQRLFSPIS